MTPIVRCSPSVAPRLRCLYWYSAGLVVLAILVGGCAQQIRDRAEDALRTGDYEKAVSELEQGLKRYPDSPVLRAGAVQARNEGVARLVAESSTARAQRRLDEAETLLQRAKVLDAGSKRVDGLLVELQTERRQMRVLTDAEALVEKRQPDQGHSGRCAGDHRPAAGAADSPRSER